MELRDGDCVRLQSKTSCRNLQLKGGRVTAQGQEEPNTQWIVRRQKNGACVRFESEAQSRSFIRINPKNNVVDKGPGGGHCFFIAHSVNNKGSPRWWAFESKKLPGKYIGAKQDGQSEVVGKMTQSAYFHVFPVASSSTSSSSSSSSSSPNLEEELQKMTAQLQKTVIEKISLQELGDVIQTKAEILLMDGGVVGVFKAEGWQKCCAAASISLQDRDIFQFGMVLAIYKETNDVQVVRVLVRALNKTAVWCEFLTRNGVRLSLKEEQIFLTSPSAILC